jgi:predicted NUDIX family NTP pyrophosphohydrolase
MILEDRTLLSFNAAMAFQAGSAPESVAVGDFNGDGIPDLAVADYGDYLGHGAGVSVLLGNGDGSFQAPRHFAAGITPISVAVGDFNGDGVLDLAVANAPFNQPGTVSVLLGNGDGSFQDAHSYAVGTYPYCMAVGDFNGDGIPDLAVANRGDNLGRNRGVSVLLGNGDGTFQDAQTFGAGSIPRSVAVGDFNGDGIPDLAVANEGSGNVSVLLGNGDGSFQAPQNFAAGTYPRSVAVGDFNGDGIPDLAVANEGSDDVSVLLGNGDGSFQAAQSFAAGRGPVSVAVGDFNGDGIPDLAVANNFSSGSGTVSVLLGNGDGSFQAAASYPVGSSPWSVAVGDFNGDGFPDLAVNNETSNDVSILLNDGVWTGPHPGPGGERSRGGPPRPRTPPASADLVAAEVVRLDPSPAPVVLPPEVAVPFVNGSQPLFHPDADRGRTPVAPAEIGATKPPVLVAVSARTARVTPWQADRLWAEPESDWLNNDKARIQEIG